MATELELLSKLLRPLHEVLSNPGLSKETRPKLESTVASIRKDIKAATPLCKLISASSAD
jgi:hypothetical protein